MKFPRRTRLLRNPFDATAYAAVFFLLVIFVSLSSRLYTPGVKISLPTASDLPGTDKPTVTVALDEFGRYYYQNQMIEAAALQAQLREASTNSPEPLTLVILADESVRYKDLKRLQMLARDAGIIDLSEAHAPQLFTAPAQP
jgi:biopolymer transport protein ExbD